MPTRLTTLANERGTYIIKVDFEDEEGTGVTPDSIKWTLTDAKGNLINSRSSVAVVTPATSVNILLSSNDLAVSNRRNTRRKLLIHAVADLAAGNNKDIYDEAEFEIANFIALA